MGREMQDEFEMTEMAVASGYGIAHDKDYARRRATERARRHKPARKFNSAAEAFAQIARDFPGNKVN